MSTLHLPGQQVRIIPRRGTVLAVEYTRIKRRKKPNGRFEYTEVPVCLVEFDDGCKARVSAWEVEASE